MESIVLERIRLVLSAKSISVNAFAKQVQIAQPTLNPQLRGDRSLSSKVIEGVLRVFPDVSAEWLLRGRGEMLLDDEANVGLPLPADSDSVWHARYDELEKRYGQLLAILGGGRSIGRQAKTG